MKPRNSTKDKVEGTLRTTKGKIKQAAGDLMDDPELHQEGKADEVAGRVQKKVGDVEKVFEQ